MPPLFVWGGILRPLGPETHSISSCLRALFSRSAPQASSDDTTIVSQQKEQLQHQHDSRDSQRNQKLAGKPRMSPSERHRLRYDSDPEYRQRRQESAKKCYQKQTLDPELHQKRIDYVRKWRADHSGDIEWFRQHVHAVNKRSNDRRYADDAFRKTKNAWLAERNKQRYCADPQFRLYQALKSWYGLQRDHLNRFVWEHWRPIYHQDRVERTCATCATTRINGSRLWFERKNTSNSSSTLYDCLRCYTESKWSKIVPTEASGRPRFYKPRDPEVLAMLEAREKE